MKEDKQSIVRSVCLFLLILSALDLTSTLIPSPADHLWPIPKRKLFSVIAQSLLLIPLVIMMRHFPKKAWTALQTSGAPLAARLCMVAFILVGSSHVALRYESFPFSPVAMFSSGVIPRTSDGVEAKGYLVVTKSGELTPFRSLLEGGDFFTRYDADWDYKAGWVMHLFGYSFSKAREKVKTVVAEGGDLHVQRTPYIYHRKTGEILSPKLVPKRNRGAP